jgi:hypothetical protein
MFEVADFSAMNKIHTLSALQAVGLFSAIALSL